ncbi:MAG: ATP-binding protein [Candidatus Latescibacteria bacterium]|nr:ATP-binding protein [Candidatus Latescibacterota bacterium]
MAVAVGFPAQGAEEIALVTSELAANLVRHAGEGEVLLVRLEEDGRLGLQVEAVDCGPGISDLDLAMTDGFSTAGGLGYGLGTANRLMEELNIETQRGKGTRVVGRRWLRPLEHLGTCPLEVGVATRPYPQMEVNGDAFVVRKWAEGALVAVIDGLGHGQLAHLAAQAAQRYVANHFDRPLEDIFRGVAHSCRATRGVVMAVARLDWGLQRLTYASVGNVEARVFGGDKPVVLTARRGVLGGRAPAPLVTEIPWEPHNLLVLHTDGLKSHWTWAEFTSQRQQSAAIFAEELLRTQARDNDDVVVIVMKGSG